MWRDEKSRRRFTGDGTSAASSRSPFGQQAGLAHTGSKGAQPRRRQNDGNVVTNRYAVGCCYSAENLGRPTVSPASSTTCMIHSPLFCTSEKFAKLSSPAQSSPTLRPSIEICEELPQAPVLIAEPGSRGFYEYPDREVVPAHESAEP
jgi:hypothetical protein